MLIFSAALALVFPSHAQKRPAGPVRLWGGLVLGPHHVGFRSYFELDHGRRDLPWSVQQEECNRQVVELLHSSPEAAITLPGACTTTPLPEKQAKLAFRPVLVAIWYPASTSLFRMRLGDYLNVPRTHASSDFASRLEQFSERTMKETLFGQHDSTTAAAQNQAIRKLLRLQTRASRNARASAGRFPVVLYHPGAAGSFDENAILCEFLATHGYVVISSAYQTSTLHVSNDAQEPGQSIHDLRFLMQTASKLPYVDITKVAGVGHSAGAQTLLRWIGEVECPLRAMVSLDSTLEYTPRDFPGHKELRQRLEAMDKPSLPVMLFASAERAPDFTTLDGFLAHAPRYEVTVEHLRHNEYLSQGAMKSALTSGKAADKMRAGYDRVCVTTKLFFDYVLKGDEKARIALTGSVAGVEVRYRAPH